MTQSIVRRIVLIGVLTWLMVDCQSVLAQASAPASGAKTEPKAAAAAPTPTPKTTAEPAKPETPAPEPTSSTFSLDQWMKDKYMTGNWWGARDKLENAGITWQPILYMGWQQNFKGGLETHNADEFFGTAYYHLKLDFEKMGIAKGLSFYIRPFSSWGSGLQDEVGSLSQPATSIATNGNQEIRVDKWWFTQKLFDNKLEFNLGKVSSLGDFVDVIPYVSYTTYFLNRWIYVNPTIPHANGLGAFVKAWPVDWAYLQAGAVDPDSNIKQWGWETAFHGSDYWRGFWETGFLSNKMFDSLKDYPGTYRVGLWYDPSNRKIYQDNLGGALADRFTNGQVGFYGDFDQVIYKENQDPKDLQGMALFARYGYARGDSNRVENFWSIGSVYRGLVPQRDNDILGFAVAQGIISHTYKDEINPFSNYETVYELFYNIQITPWLTFTPDFQVISNPGGTSTTPDSIVGGFRLRFDL